MSDAQSLTLALGGRWRGNSGIARCVCHDDKTPSLSIRDGDIPGRLLFKCFAGCDSRDIVAELRQRGLLVEPPTRPPRKFQTDRRRSVSEPDHKPDADALEIWRSASSESPDIGTIYLRRRGISIAIPPSLRSGTKLHLGRYQMPVLVAAVQAPAGHIIAVQTTLLRPDGQKAPVAFPRITTGALGYGAVRLARAGKTLGLAEGIETALSAMQIFNVPCWATLGAGRMCRVQVPRDVQELHVFADNDEPGKAAADATAKAHQFRRVVIHFPPTHHKDFNDALRASDREAA